MALFKDKSSSSDSKDKEKSKSSGGGSSSKDKSGGSSGGYGGGSSISSGSSSSGKDKSGSGGGSSIASGGDGGGSSYSKEKSKSKSGGSGGSIASGGDSSSGKTKSGSPSSSASSGKSKSPSSSSLSSGGKDKSGGLPRGFLSGGTKSFFAGEDRNDPKQKTSPIGPTSPSWEQFQDFNELSSMPSLENMSPAQQLLLTDPGAIDQVIAGFEPTAALTEALGGFLAEGNRHREERIAERAEAGVTPSEGPIDWNAIFYDLNAPKRERGVEFEGPVDWGGIGNAIGGMFGGIPEALTGPAPRLMEPPRQAPGTNFGGFVERGQPYSTGPKVDPESGFVQDPRTGTYYPPEVVERLVAEDPAALQSPAVQQALAAETQRVLGGGAPAGIAEAVAPSGIAMATEVLPPMPRKDPRVFTTAGPLRERGETPPPVTYDAPPTVPPDMAAVVQPETLMPGMVPGAQPQPSGAPAAREPTMWENVVDMAGSVADNTLLGTAVKHLFPDVWYGAGEMMKGNGGFGLSGTLSESEFNAANNFGSIASRGEGRFPDENRNGIDDRLEKPPKPSDPIPPPVTPDPNAPKPGTVSPTEYDRWGEVVFPDLPPYNPGIDPEWLYFRKRYAEGGIVDAASPNNPGPMSGIDPRVVIIADAEDALAGQHPEPERAIQAFIEAFGPEALEVLKTQVSAGMTLRGKKGRLVEGPGGPKDDAIPATIEGQEPAALSDGEYVLSAAAVEGAGKGDREAGAAQLAQLDDMLASQA